MVSTASAFVANAAPAMTLESSSANADGFITISLRSGLHRSERVAGAVLLDVPCGRERKMVAADHQFVGDHAVEQLAAGRFRQVCILIVGAVPFGMSDHERRHIGSVVRDHELARPGRQMECAMAWGMAGRADEADAGR